MDQPWINHGYKLVRSLDEVDTQTVGHYSYRSDCVLTVCLSAKPVSQLVSLFAI